MNQSINFKIDTILNILIENKDKTNSMESLNGYLTIDEIVSMQNLLLRHEIDTILEFLIDSDLVIVKEFCIGVDCNIPIYHYKLSIKGLLFVEKTSFTKEKCKYRLKQTWIIVKTIAIVLNAIAIISIMIWGILHQNS